MSGSEQGGAGQGGGMKISELAEEGRVTPRALRHYEERGLIKPSARSEGGFRLYSESQRTRLEYIQRLKSLGCSLGEIQALLESWGTQPTAPEGMRALEALYREKLQGVREAIARLQGVERELAESLSFIEGCHECPSEAAPTEGCARCDRSISAAPTLIRGVMEPSR